MTVDMDIAGIGGDVAAALDTITRQLHAAGVDSARLDARLLVGAATGESTAGLIARPERFLSPAEAARLSDMVARRCAREPMAHILGTREFWSLDFAVSASVLTPRPDSETLVDAAVAHLPDRQAPLRILDLGTGSGCLLLALLHEFPAATGTGIDISPEAVALARCNAESLGLGARCGFAVGDWTAPLAGRFDAVVSNPPYIAAGDIAALAPEVARYEPRGALDGGADGLDAYRALLPRTAEILAPGGTAFFEMGAGQDAEIVSLARSAGLETVQMRADITGIPRVAILRHIETRCRFF